MSPSIIETDIEAVGRVLRSGMLVQGSEVALLEQRLSSFIGCEYVSMASNGTATLHLALIALGVGVGDEVILPAFSYIATANVIELVGARPVFIDIDLRTFNIDSSKVEEKISKKTKAIIAVHEFGLACDVSKILTIADKYNIPLIEDAACALGATEHGKSVGTFGVFGSFSFHPRKAISSGEGGALTCKDDRLKILVRTLRNHGIETANGVQEFTKAGFNYRMTDIQASLLLSQLARLKGILKIKNDLAEVYYNEIDTKGVLLPIVPENKKHTWQTFHLLISEGIDRKRLISDLKNYGIGSNYGAQCIPAQQYYQRKYHLDCKLLFPNALNAYQNGLAIPLYEKLSKTQIKYISEQINKLTR